MICKQTAIYLTILSKKILLHYEMTLKESPYKKKLFQIHFRYLQLS